MNACHVHLRHGHVDRDLRVARFGFLWHWLLWRWQLLVGAGMVTIILHLHVAIVTIVVAVASAHQVAQIPIPPLLGRLYKRRQFLRDTRTRELHKRIRQHHVLRAHTRHDLTLEGVARRRKRKLFQSR